MNPKLILEEFDLFLKKKNLKFEAIFIGAAALNLLGIIQRETIDIDVLTPDIPFEILEAAKDFRSIQKKKGIELIEKWFNNGPSSLRNYLPLEWRDRIQKVFNGKAITAFTLSRIDLIGTKILAYCDRDERDFGDLLKIRPARSEILEVESWVAAYDTNPDWPRHVRGKLENLARELGYEL